MTHGVTGDESPNTNRSIGSTESKRSDIVEIAGDLTKFQDRILDILAVDNFSGREVQERLEAYYQKEINHGRLYPNLDTVVDKGLVEKSQRDRRTNEYELTELGRRVIERDHEWTADRLEGEGVFGGDA